MSFYFDEMQRVMTWLGEKPDTQFIGQAVGVPGTFMFNTLNGVPQEKRLEFPVAEEFNLQFNIGLALTGTCVVGIFPRQNFLLLAMSALVNTLDKFKDISHGEVWPHVILRSAEAPNKPFGGGHQHETNAPDGFRAFLKNIEVIDLTRAVDVFNTYEKAYYEKKPVLIIEHANLYND